MVSEFWLEALELSYCNFVLFLCKMAKWPGWQVKTTSQGGKWPGIWNFRSKPSRKVGSEKRKISACTLVIMFCPKPQYMITGPRCPTIQGKLAASSTTLHQIRVRLVWAVHLDPGVLTDTTLLWRFHAGYLLKLLLERKRERWVYLGTANLKSIS